MLAVAAALVLVATPAVAQVLRGTVLDSTSTKPVGGVRVVVFSAVGVRMGDAVTRPDGQFTFHLHAAGDYRLHASRLGYETTITGPVVVAATSESSVLLRLVPRPVSLDTLSVAAPGAVPYLAEVGFYRRRQSLYGYFMTRAKIERYSRYSHNMSDVLRHFVELQVVCNIWQSCDVRIGGPTLKSRPRVLDMGRMGPCPPSVVLDGKVLRIGFAELPWGSTVHERLNPVLTVDELLEPFNIEALEVYPGTGGPLQWGWFVNPCGAILAWSRR